MFHNFMRGDANSFEYLEKTRGKQAAQQLAKEATDFFVGYSINQNGYCKLPLKHDFITNLYNHLLYEYSRKYEVFVDSDTMYIVEPGKGRDNLMDMLHDREAKLHTSYIEIQTLKKAIQEKSK